MKVIAHVDMDAFYTQVEIGRDLDRLAGQPVVVIQYNPFGDLSTLRPEDDRIKPESNGSIIAVSYEARKHGVKRNMMAQQAKKLCPSLKIVQVPVAHGKADLAIYRDAGAAVINVLSKSAVCERASIDEAYLDVTAAAQRLLGGGALLRKPPAAGGGAAAAAGAGAPAGTADAAAGTAGADELAAAIVAAAEAGEVDVAAAQQQDGDDEEEQDDGGVSVRGAAVVLPLPASFEGWHVAGVEPAGPEGVRDWWCRPALAWDQSDALLAAGAHVVAKARAAVKASLGFSCSAGIAHSKILAKLGSGLNKPDQQTIVPAAAVAGLLAPLPVSKLRQLGGKFGEEIQAKLNVATVGELAAVPLSRLEAVLNVQDAAWLHRLAQGKDGEEVVPRTLPKSISCGKTFRGQNVLTGLTAVHTWLLQLGQELQERIEADRQQHQRLPKLLTVSFDSAPVGEAGPSSSAPAAAAGAPAAADAAGSSGSGSGLPATGRMTAQNWRAGATNISRSCALRHARAEVIAADALGLVKKWARDRPNGFRIVTMFVSASNFSIAPTGASTLDRFLAGPAAAAAAAAAAKAGKLPAAQQEQHQQGHHQQQEQQPEGCKAGVDSNSSAAAPAAPGSSTAARLAGTKRHGSSASKYGKAARTDKQQGSLRAFLSAAPALAEQQLSTPPASAASNQPAAAGAAASDTAAACRGWEADCVADAERVRGDSGEGGREGGGAVALGGGWHPPFAGSGVDAGVFGSSPNAAGAGRRATDPAAPPPAAAAGSFAAPRAVPIYKPVSPARPALSALQLLSPAVPGGAVLLAGPAGHQQPSTQPPMQTSTEAPLAHGAALPAQHDGPCLPAWPAAVATGAAVHSNAARGAATQPTAQGVSLRSGQGGAGISGVCREQASYQQLPTTQQQQQPQPAQLQQEQAAVHGAAAQAQGALQKQEQLPGSSTHQLQGVPQQQGLAAAHLQLSDIDPEVLAALPWDIQLEVQQQLRARPGGGGAAAAAGSRRGSRGAARGRAGGAGGRRQQAHDQGSILAYLNKK